MLSILHTLHQSIRHILDKIAWHSPQSSIRKCEETVRERVCTCKKGPAVARSLHTHSTSSLVGSLSNSWKQTCTIFSVIIAALYKCPTNCIFPIALLLTLRFSSSAFAIATFFSCSVIPAHVQCQNTDTVKAPHHTHGATVFG